MPGSQRCKLPTLANEERAAAHEQCASSCLSDSCKGGINFPLICRFQEHYFPTDRSDRRSCVSRFGLDVRKIRIKQHGDHCSLWNELVQKAKPLPGEFDRIEDHARNVTARMVEARDQPDPDWIDTGYEHDRSRRRDRHGRLDWNETSDDHGHAAAHEVGCHFRQPVVLIIRPAILDGDALALDEASFAQSPLERSYKVRRPGCRRAPQKPDHRHRRLLPPCRHRPRRRRAAEQGDELAAATSFDHLVGAGEQHRGRFEAERPGGL